MLSVSLKSLSSTVDSSDRLESGSFMSDSNDGLRDNEFEADAAFFFL